MAASPVKLPPGFQLEEAPQAQGIKLPPGFQLEEAAPAPPEGSTAYRALSGAVEPTVQMWKNPIGIGTGGVIQGEPPADLPPQTGRAMWDTLKKASANWSLRNAGQNTVDELKTMNPVAMDKFKSGDVAGGITKSAANLAYLASGLRPGAIEGASRPNIPTTPMEAVRAVTPSVSLRQALGKVAKLTDESLLTDLIGVASPRLAHAQRVVGRVGKLVSKAIPEDQPAAVPESGFKLVDRDPVTGRWKMKDKNAPAAAAVPRETPFTISAEQFKREGGFAQLAAKADASPAAADQLIAKLEKHLEDIKADEARAFVDKQLAPTAKEPDLVKALEDSIAILRARKAGRTGFGLEWRGQMKRPITRK